MLGLRKTSCYKRDKIEFAFDRIGSRMSAQDSDRTFIFINFDSDTDKLFPLYCQFTPHV